jgi:membrane protease YdiL (CAAX protease family)
MKRIKYFAIQRPLAFSLAITFLFVLLVLISSIVVGRIWTGNTPGWYVGNTIGRLTSIFILLFLIARLGWLHSAGFTSAGNLRTWLILLIPLTYSIATSAYAMTGNFDFSYSDPGLTAIAVPFIISHAFLEEVVFRGLILHALIRARDTTSRGIVMSVLVSSLLFGGYHILYLAGEPLPVVLPRIVFSTLLGIVSGAFVLRGESIYPAAFFHGILNLAGFLNLTSNGVEGTGSSWLLMSLFILPLALYGLYLLRDSSRSLVNLNSPLSNKYSAG